MRGARSSTCGGVRCRPLLLHPVPPVRRCAVRRRAPRSRDRRLRPAQRARVRGSRPRRPAARARGADRHRSGGAPRPGRGGKPEHGRRAAPVARHRAPGAHGTRRGDHGLDRPLHVDGGTAHPAPVPARDLRRRHRAGHGRAEPAAQAAGGPAAADRRHARGHGRWAVVPQRAHARRDRLGGGGAARAAPGRPAPASAHRGGGGRGRGRRGRADPDRARGPLRLGRAGRLARRHRLAARDGHGVPRLAPQRRPGRAVRGRRARPGGRGRPRPRTRAAARAPVDDGRPAARHRGPPARCGGRDRPADRARGHGHRVRARRRRRRAVVGRPPRAVARHGLRAARGDGQHEGDRRRRRRRGGARVRHHPSVAAPRS